ncbi:MAG TPA: hypothetical protein VLA91_03260 [Acidimicrobiia bacterium]|nr:hypothetical protein [Acidimicrobiia bacterium]
MTTELPGTPEPTQPPEPTPPRTTAGPSLGSMSGETLVMIGAALVLASYVIFQLITGDLFQYITTLVAAAFAVLIPLVDKDRIGGIAPVPVLMKALGYIIAVSGIFEILYAVRFDVMNDAMAVIASLVAYAGYVLAFLGARSIEA